MPLPPKDTLIASTLTQEAIPPNATPRAGSPEAHAAAVLKAKQEAGTEEAVKVAAIIEIPQETIDSKSTQIQDTTRQTEFKNSADLLKKYIEGIGLTPAEKGLLLPYIEGVIRQNGPLKRNLGTNANIRKYARWMLENQSTALSSSMFTELDAVLKKASPVTDAELSTAEADHKTKLKEEKTAKFDRDEARATQKSWQQELDQFRDPTIPGSKAEKLQKASDPIELSNRESAYKLAKSEEETAQAKVDRLQHEYDESRQKGPQSPRRDIPTIVSELTNNKAILSPLASKKTRTQTEEITYQATLAKDQELGNELALTKAYGTSPGRRELSVIETELNTARSDLNTKRTAREQSEFTFKEKDRLEAEKKKADEELSKAKRALLEAEAKLTTAKGNSQTAETKLKELQQKHAAWEQDMVRDIHGVMTKATVEWINKSADDLDEFIDKYSKEQAEKDKTKLEQKQAENNEKVRKKVRELTTNPKKKKVGKFGRKQEIIVRETDPVKAFQQMSELLEKGPAEYLRTRCRDAGISGDEIDRIVKDDTLRQDMITEVMGRHMKANGILPQQIEEIERSSWGTDTIMKAIQKNEAIQKQIEAALGAGVLTDKHKFWEAIKNNKWLLLVILLGGIAGAAIGGPPGFFAGATGVSGIAAVAASEAGAAAVGATVAGVAVGGGVASGVEH
jgi:hypothetical protein